MQKEGHPRKNMSQIGCADHSAVATPDEGIKPKKEREPSKMMDQRDKLQVVFIVVKTSAKHKTQIKLFNEKYFTIGGLFKVQLI